MNNTKETSPIVTTTRKGDITFHSNGRMDIKAHVARTLDLKTGDVVNIVERGNYCKEYYLYVVRRKEQVVGRHACTCHSVKNKGNYLRVFNKALTTFMLRLCHAEDKISVRVGSMETIQGIGAALPLITLQPQSTMTL